jgi:hypothetical protein
MEISMVTQLQVAVEENLSASKYGNIIFEYFLRLMPNEPIDLIRNIIVRVETPYILSLDNISPRKLCEAIVGELLSNRDLYQNMTPKEKKFLLCAFDKLEKSRPRTTSCTHVGISPFAT